MNKNVYIYMNMGGIISESNYFPSILMRKNAYNHYSDHFKSYCDSPKYVYSKS